MNEQTAKDHPSTPSRTSALDEVAATFEQHRTHLRAVAYRLVGSVPEADDAVQEAWLRVQRSDLSTVENLPAWLTTVVSRICLDQLRSRSARREDLAAEHPDIPDDPALDPAAEAVQADEVGRALMIVLDTLRPAERLAFCLHDLFGLSFDELSPTLGRSTVACRQLVSRARRRVRGQGQAVEIDRERQREVVEAFMDASKNADFTRLLELLHPDAVLSSDAVAAAMGSPVLISGGGEVARFFNGKAKAARRAELDGFAAAKWTLRGELKVVFAFTVEDGLVRGIELLADDLERLDVR
jgi:RNA polymerase sigma-70 factor (ECF subfamily)